ncbi:hypothetical protein SUZIE_207100 [Sciurus carolinensis]|uniref:DUF4629 domain-containing protein n=1 Tax=Sciurus carolinensis TaxID=30640 RepID=A0AA41TBF2_SCICA|nr:hypothetical protein [Sciurus carolinensis]
MGSAYLYQHSSTAMLSGVTRRHQIPMAPASYPSIFEWDNMGGAEKKSSALGDFTLTVTDQDTAAPSMSMTVQYDTPSDANVIVPEYPALSARLVQGTPSQIPNQARTLSLPYQAESQVHYHDQNTLGPLLSGDLGPYLQSYGSVSYAGSRAAVPQPEMVMVLKDVQSTNVLPSVSTPGIDYSVSTQPITGTSFQVRKPWLQVKGPEKTQVRAQKPDISADKECPSPSQYELPPPGKVKLVPLPFLSPEKPQPRPVYRRPQSLASSRPTVAYPAQPASTSSAQPRAVNQCRPAPANTSFMRPAKPAQPAVSHSIHSGFTTSTQPSVSWSAASRPAAYTSSSCTSEQRGPVSTLVNKLQSQPPKPQNRYLLQDFALQPIPWRKSNVPGPVMSTPITEEQRPEQEAMKKKAQQERENAAKYPLGRVQFFIEREREMEFAHYYGYTI